MHVGLLEVSIFIPYAESLKDKRSIVKSLLGKVQAQFKISAAEVGDNELWQRARLGFAIVGNDARFIESRLDKLLNYIEEHVEGQVVDVFKDIENFGAQR